MAPSDQTSGCAVEQYRLTREEAATIKRLLALGRVCIRATSLWQAYLSEEPESLPEPTYSDEARKYIEKQSRK